jgi:SAM-dependent methyltransferase
MSRKVVFNIDDFCDNDWQIMDYLFVLKEKYPGFKVTLFTISSRISIDHLSTAKKMGWIELPVHGFNHSPKEMLTLSKINIAKGFSEIDFSMFARGFRAPYWLMTEQCIECCNEFKMWVAIHHTKNNPAWKNLCEYGYYYPIDRDDFECWYAHTYNVKDELPNLLEKWPSDQQFVFVSEALQRVVKLNFCSGINPKTGFVNLDMKDLAASFPGYDMRMWNFSDGLKIFGDNSVDAATVSHGLMFLRTEEYLEFFAEVRRVLKSGGVFRVTEDDCENPDCGKYGLPSRNPPSETGPKMMRTELMKAGFDVYDLPWNETHWIDNTLIQHFHGDPPRVFSMEAIKK